MFVDRTDPSDMNPPSFPVSRRLPAPSTGARRFIAISIDLCGSTYVKQRIVQLAGTDILAQRQMLGAYKKLLYGIERTFYQSILYSPEIEFERLTLIKTIGDELWYAYQLDRAPSQRELCGVRKLLSALLSLVSSDRNLTLSGGACGGGVEEARFDLPIKVYADLVSECEELNYERYEHLKESVATAQGKASTVIEIDEAYIATCERLNLSMPKCFDDRPTFPAREDFVGLEIDRFFRLTEQCYPRLLTVGQKLFDLVECPLKPAPDFEHLELKIVELEKEDDFLAPVRDQVFGVKCPVASWEMKGIGEDYSVVHLFDLPCLGADFAAPSPLVETMMGETRGFLATKGIFAVLGHARLRNF